MRTGQKQVLPGKSSASWAIVNGRLVFSDGPQRADLLIEDGRISAIGRLPETWSGPTIDVGQMLVAPGFIDLQINGGYGIDFTTDGNAIWKVAELLPQQGVTSFLPTIISSPQHSIGSAQTALSRSPSHVCAAPLGLHLEGPMLNPARRGAHSGEHLKDPSALELAGWTAGAGIAMVTIAPELPGALDVIGQLARGGVIVAAGHSAATVEEASEAASVGISHITHIYNAMSPFHHRDPGLVGFALARRDITASIIADGIHSHPTAIAAAWNAKGSSGIALVTDASAAKAVPDTSTARQAGKHQGGLPQPSTESSAERQAGQAPVIVDGSETGEPKLLRLGDSQLTFQGEAVRNQHGTLAGSRLTMPRAVRNLIEWTGCGIAEAVKSATTTPARVIGASSKGVLAVGRDADIIAFDEELHIALTIVGGRIAHDPHSLVPVD